MSHDVTLCRLCYKTAVQPKLLPCFHSFCLKCLESNVVAKKSPHGTIVCPKCSRMFYIPAQGLVGLQRNIFAERLARISNALCDVCSDDLLYDKAEVPSATMYCSVCCQGLCERCTAEHKRQKLSKTHQLEEFGKQIIHKQAQKLPLRFCEIHPMEPFGQIYCLTCRKDVCAVCYLQDHQDHKWIKSEEIVGEFREKVKTSGNHASKLLNEILERRTLLIIEEKQCIADEMEKMMVEIQRRYDDLKKLMDQHKRNLIYELNLHKETRFNEIKKEMDDKTGHYLAQFKDYMNYCSELQNIGSAHEIYWAVNDMGIESTLENFKTLQLEILKILDNRLTAPFRFAFVQTELGERNILGTIESKIQTEQIEKRPVRATIDIQEKDAWGVAWLNDKIFILTEKSILAYSDQHPFPFRQQIEIDVPGKGYVSDIAASEVSDCLYATDQGSDPVQKEQDSFKESCIWKITEDGRVSKWIRSNTGRLITLSVASDGRVIVSTMTWKKNVLRIYSKDAREIASISLPHEIQYINHGVELADETYIIAHGKGAEKQSGVTEIKRTRTGQSVISRRIENEVLSHPWHLAVCRKNEVDLFLADSMNDRVLLLDSLLQLKKVLLTKEKDRINVPRRLCYVKKRDMLLVVHGEKGTKRIVDLFFENYWSQ